MSLEIIQKPISRHVTLYIYIYTQCIHTCVHIYIYIYTYIYIYIYIYVYIYYRWIMIYPDDLLQLRQVTRSCTKVAVATRNMKKLRSKSWNRADVATPIAGWKKKKLQENLKKRNPINDGWYICYVNSMDYHLLSMIIYQYGISLHVTSFHHKTLYFTTLRTINRCASPNHKVMQMNCIT